MWFECRQVEKCAQRGRVDVRIDAGKAVWGEVYFLKIGSGRAEGCAPCDATLVIWSFRPEAI